MTGRGGDSAAQRAAEIRRKAAAAKQARDNGTRRAPKGQSQTALTRDAKAWAAGAVGEERVARQLARLNRTEGVVLNDRLLDPAKAWNLDHLVIAPMGVLFVDAKNWRGDLAVWKGALWRHYNAGPKAGRKSEPMTSEVAKVSGMAAHASARLRYPVRPVICLAGSRAREFDQAAVVSGVVVIAADRIARWIRDSPPTVRPADLPVLAAAAERLFPPAGPARPLSEFERRLRETGG